MKINPIDTLYIIGPVFFLFGIQNKSKGNRYKNNSKSNSINLGREGGGGVSEWKGRGERD